VDLQRFEIRHGRDCVGETIDPTLLGEDEVGQLRTRIMEPNILDNGTPPWPMDKRFRESEMVLGFAEKYGFVQNRVRYVVHAPIDEAGGGEVALGGNVLEDLDEDFVGQLIQPARREEGGAHCATQSCKFGDIDVWVMEIMVENLGSRPRILLLAPFFALFAVALVAGQNPARED
jgi:hypothetical protein